MKHKLESKIGILGGTFNPIHNGHLIIAETVCESFGLDKVLLIPSGQPPHKPDSEVIDPEHRFAMVTLAVNSNPHFEASRIEIDKEGTTYTVNTLRALKKSYGDGSLLHFIIGADVIPELTTWKDFKEVFGLCEFIAVRRPGFGLQTVKTAIKRLAADFGASIHLTNAPMIDISSSGIRENCRTGKSIRYLVPDEVMEYIKAEGLYGKRI